MPSLDARVRLLRSRIHEGWTLAALGVLLGEAAPNQLTSSADHAISIRSELESLARVMRAHPYVQGSLESGDPDAARSAAPMVGTAFDTALSRIGHRGPDSFELAASVIGDRPAALLAAARRTTARITAPDHDAPPHRGVAYDSTLRFTHQLRSAVRELARRRVVEDKLATAQDIFFLTVDEALAMPVDTRLRVKRRAAERERLQAMTMPSAFDGTWTPAPNPWQPTTMNNCTDRPWSLVWPKERSGWCARPTMPICSPVISQSSPPRILKLSCCSADLAR